MITEFQVGVAAYGRPRRRPVEPEPTPSTRDVSGADPETGSRPADCPNRQTNEETP